MAGVSGATAATLLGGCAGVPTTPLAAGMDSTLALVSERGVGATAIGLAVELASAFAPGKLGDWEGGLRAGMADMRRNDVGG
jgi:hypothetical protein